MVVPLLLLLALPAAADLVPDIPRRDDLPRTLSGEEGRSVPPGAAWEELKKVIDYPKVSQARVDAVYVFGRRMGAAESQEPEALPKAVSDALSSLEGLLEREEDPAFRRYAVAELFGSGAAAVRDYVPYHPKASWARAAWKRLDAVRRRGLKDKDPRLAEFFERYRTLPGGASWEALKAEDKAFFDKAASELPDKREVLEKIWGLCESIESSQRAVSDRLLPAVRKAAKGSPKAAGYEKAARATFEYRSYTLWGN
ncbi:hypothetical protein EPO15_09080, partial [bacterium]